LVAVGAIREILGSGTLLAGMDLLLGPIAENWTITLFSNYSGFLVAILPPGAFIVTGFLIAIKNVIDNELEKREKANRTELVVKGSKRVRTTGTIS